MAEWQYRIQSLELTSGSGFDQELESALVQHGEKGWELVEILPLPEHSSGVAHSYRLIFKAPKPLD